MSLDMTEELSREQLLHALSWLKNAHVVLKHEGYLIANDIGKFLDALEQTRSGYGGTPQGVKNRNHVAL